MQWPDRSREDTRQALGFFIGEEPVDPFAGQPLALPPTSETLTMGALLLGKPEVGVRLSVLAEAGLLPAGFATGPP